MRASTGAAVPFARNDVTFLAEGVRCAAWFYRPDPASQVSPVPLIVMAHGLGGVKEARLDAFAERFAAAGYACLVFDYRHFGASGGEPRQLLDVRRQRDDWRAAVAFGRTLEGVDPERVVVWGTSFGGGHVIVTAADDPRIVAVVAQCPFTDGLASTLAIPPAVSVRVTLRALRDVVASAVGRPPVMIPLHGDPGTTALMTASDASPGMEALLPQVSTYENSVAARVALQILTSSPGKRAKGVTCPMFVAVCERDTVAPPGPTRRALARAPRATVRLYDAGHFDVYVGDWFEHNVADQLDFLALHVPLV